MTHQTREGRITEVALLLLGLGIVLFVELGWLWPLVGAAGFALLLFASTVWNLLTGHWDDDQH